MNPFTLVDVGASGGIDPRWYESFPEIRSVLVEPDDRAIIESDDKHVLIRKALYSSKKTIEFNVCRDQECSSIYMPNMKLLSKFPKAQRHEVLRKIQLEADTLDNQILVNEIREIDFIKLDTQGSEYDILLGASNTLKQALGVQVEVSFVPLYSEQPLFDSVHRYLSEQGYELYDLQRSCWIRSGTPLDEQNKGQMLFGDALYFNKGRADEGRVRKMIDLFLHYGFTDCAREAIREYGVKFDQALSDSIYRASLPMMQTSFKGKSRVGKWLRTLADRVFNVPRTEWNRGSDEFIGNQR